MRAQHAAEAERKRIEAEQAAKLEAERQAEEARQANQAHRKKSVMKHLKAYWLWVLMKQKEKRFCKPSIKA